MCGTGHVDYIWKIFGECVITTRDKWSFAIGMISNFMWVISSAPQIYQNYATKEVEGQSPFLFSLLEVGNLLSLGGIIITHGLVTQIITAALYALLDGILLFQYVYYRCQQEKKRRASNDEDYKTKGIVEEETKYPDSSKKNIVQTKNKQMYKKKEGLVLTDDNKIPTGLTLFMLTKTAKSVPNWKAPYVKKEIVGTLFGWIGGFVYIGSRIPQVAKNFANRKVKSMSPIYVIFTILGEITYLLSVIVKSIDCDFLWMQAPFIFASIGPLICDVIITIQMVTFGVEKDSAHALSESDDEIFSEDRQLDEL